jgi:hypothetical protein
MTSKTSTARGLVSLHLPVGLGTMSCPTTHWLRASKCKHFTVWRIRHPGESLLPSAISWRFRRCQACKPTWIASAHRRAHTCSVPGADSDSPLWRMQFACDSQMATPGTRADLRIAHLLAGWSVEQICESHICWQADHSQMATPERRADLRIAHLLAGWSVEQICESHICWQAGHANGNSGASSRFANRTFAGRLERRADLRIAHLLAGWPLANGNSGASSRFAKCNVRICAISWRSRSFYACKPTWIASMCRRAHIGVYLESGHSTDSRHSPPRTLADFARTHPSHVH